MVRAVEGMVSAPSTWSMVSRRETYMPSFRRASGLSMERVTSTVRLVVLTVGLMVLMVAAKRSSGQALAVKVACMPSSKVER